MSSVLAIVSKAVFEKMVPKNVKVGDLVATDHYLSKVKAFDTLREGGSLFLVTVRPPNEQLWLVAVLETPKPKDDGWHAAANQTPIADVTSAIPQFVFASHAGLVAKPGALGMSLQTPRVLTAGDEALLRGLAGGKAAPEVDAAPAQSAMKLTHAVRLLRKDIDRLTPIHQKQFHAMMAPKWTFEKAAALIGTTNPEDEGGGLVYLRVEDSANAKRAFEVWIYDDAGYRSTSVGADGARAFVAGTLDPIGLEMSQSCWHPAKTPDAEAVLAFLKPQLRTLKVAVKGPALTANPPFALATAPLPVLADAETGALDLEVAAARRLTEKEARALPAESRFQLLHGSRSQFATDDPKDMEDPMQLGMVYGFVDPGPDADAFGYKEGLIYLRLKTKESKPREYEGWFYDGRIEEAESYWPSAKATLTSGRLFERGTVRFTGVEVKSTHPLVDGRITMKPRIAVDAKHGLPVANALAAGLKKLGFSFDVAVTQKPEPADKPYFGTAEHTKALEQQRRGYKAEEAEKAKRKKGGGGSED